MKTNKWLGLLLVAILALTVMAGGAFAQVLREAPKKIYTPSEENFGYVPFPLDLSHLQPSPQLMAPLQPPSWDWRPSGVSSVKNQNPYGTCWAFAAMGDLESKVMINESFEPDYSELNLVACNAYNTTCNTGSHAWCSAGYLTTYASVEESCDPYPGGCPTPACINPACPFKKQLIEWRVIPNDVTAIKNAVMAYGPVNVAMYAGFPGFGSYDGSYCLTYTGPEDPNHAVLIVGWDDSMCEGNGGWIVKNSWGTAWGDNGFFYIEYGNAKIGTDATVMTAYKDPDPNETIYYWDERGWEVAVGYDNSDCALVEITPTANEYLLAVDFWATDGPTSYILNVYDDFDGSNLTNLIVGPISGSFTEAGYYSLAIDPPVLVSTGDAIYLKMALTTTVSYPYPVPLDQNGPMETNKSYLSDTGASWTALDNGGYAIGDAGLRARIGIPSAPPTDCSKEGDPAFYVGFGEDYHEVIAGGTYCWTVGATNFGFVSSTCTETDTFCVWAEDVMGWAITGDPPLEGCHILDPGYLWWQDVCITVPCDVNICDYDTLIIHMTYCDDALICRHDCDDLPECEDPNWYGGNPYYSSDTILLHVTESPPALYILQDSLYYVDQGQTAAYIPFTICNGDPCADANVYSYCITSKGHVGSAINQCDDTSPIGGGECEDVFGIIDAGDADVCDYDTLTIIAWDAATGTVYDTCVQVIHVIHPVPVPLFSAPVVTILVFAMILVTALILKRRAASSA